MLKRFSFAAVAILIVALVAGCGGGGADNASTTTESGEAETQRFEIVGTEFAFEPNALTVKEGQEVELVFKNEGTIPHDLRIDEFGVNSGLVQPGESKTITFRPNKTGGFEIHCNEAGHKPSGMVGTLTVEG